MKRIESDNPARQAVNDRIDERVKKTNILRRSMVIGALGLGAVFGVSAQTGETGEAVSAIGFVSTGVIGAAVGVVDGRRMKKYVRTAVADYAEEQVGNRHDDGSVVRVLSIDEAGKLHESVEYNWQVFGSQVLAKKSTSVNALATPSAVASSLFITRAMNGSLNLEEAGSPLLVTAASGMLVGGIALSEMQSQSVKDHAHAMLDAIDDGTMKFNG